MTIYPLTVKIIGLISIDLLSLQFKYLINKNMQRIRDFIKLLGPGLLYAGAAVGVSHLVQSTRAGANYGFDLLWILLLANIIKYPFFEFGARYPALTGKSLIEGYQSLGKWAVILFTLLTISTMFTIQAAVTIVTAGLVANVFGWSLSPVTISAIILILTMIILGYGRYSLLDKMIKWVIIILSFSTLVAVISASIRGFVPDSQWANHFTWTKELDILFLIAFVGWMPAPIDVSVWQSLWGVAKAKELGKSPNLRQSLMDFNIGYIGTAFLALGFLALGALVMYGSGEELSAKGTVFAGQLIDLYTQSIGGWAFIVIAIAAIATMFSTTLTCLDAYPRVMKPLTRFFLPGLKPTIGKWDWLSWFWIIIVVGGALSILFFFQSGMRFMVDLATTLSFLTAPLLAFLNYKVLSDKHIQQKLPVWLKYYAIAGILFLSAFALFFLYYKFL
jgi:Mn2+/Fe2+ NRAMP family transporter